VWLKKRRHAKRSWVCIGLVVAVAVVAVPSQSQIAVVESLVEDLVRTSQSEGLNHYDYDLAAICRGSVRN
jgi:hypothetical protein